MYHATHIPLNDSLAADLSVPDEAKGLVIFALAVGSGRFSAKYRRIAACYREHGLATLLIDLEEHEHAVEPGTRNGLLAQRLISIVLWATRFTRTNGLPVGLYGAGLGSTAALKAASWLGHEINAVISLNGKMDVAREELVYIQVPILFMLDTGNSLIKQQNRKAFHQVCTAKEFVVMPSGESKKMQKLADISLRWVLYHLTPSIGRTKADLRLEQTADTFTKKVENKEKVG